MNPSLHIDAMVLRVADLARSRRFYVEQLGFEVRQASDDRVELVAPGGHARLTLLEDRDARPAPRHSAGLFHAAVLLPSRAALGRWLEAAARHGVSFDGFSDHGVSEAIYLRDPDGNGLEFYADRPAETWPRQAGELAMVTQPLDVADLLEAARREPARTPLDGAVWGHLHLRVSNLDRSEAFYSSTLGLHPTQRYGSEARFLAADGYHHHVGLNTWGGVNQPQPAGALGLVEATVTMPGGGAKLLADPDGIHLRIRVRDAAEPAVVATVTGSP